MEKAIVRRMLCGQAKSLGRLMEAYGVNNSVTVSGLMDNLCMWKTGFNSRYELRLVALSNYSGCGSGEQCSKLVTVRGGCPIHRRKSNIFGIVTRYIHLAMMAEWLRQERNSLCGWYFSYKFFL